ncbi:MAG: ATP-dependent rRNA helicase DbpA, partial [Myxococcaceae bacterium]|nr:ATP-dependent rRNA helicase DbpA [Myxococcaceae bacterium]
EVVASLGFDKLTPIQEASIPVLLEGKDLVGQSKTGSGKTAAFALPILQRLTMETRALKALVLCPTRELSAQVARELRKLGRNLPGLQVLVLAGGEPLRGQANALERGVHIAVGTPGRVLDHLRRNILDLRHTETIVLDEADRMLDMGFEEEMEQILDALPVERQTVFFSATFPESIVAMSRKYQSQPVRVTIENDEGDSLLMRQLLLKVDPDAKLAALRWTLSHFPHESALIFANFKASVAQLEKALGNAGMSVSSLHGDLEQFERDRVMAKFRNASTRVLVATDVAARGIDIESLDLVINYDLPVTPEVYVHRIGRTGRAGKQGLTIAFAGPRDQDKIHDIEAHTKVKFERIKMEADAALEEGEVEPAEQPLTRDAKMDTLRIAGGRKQKMRPGDILGALTGEAGGLSGTDIGKIEIHDNFAYVAVAKSVSRRAQQSLSNGKIKGKKFVVSLIK